MVLKTYPPFASMACRIRASWRERAACICRGNCSQRFVEPSISVNKNVTVPLGRLITLVLKGMFDGLLDAHRTPLEPCPLECLLAQLGAGGGQVALVVCPLSGPHAGAYEHPQPF